MTGSVPRPKPGDGYRRFVARLGQVRSQGVSLGLDRMQLALERLGHPELRVPAIHIAGTNGKGSVAALSDSILRQSGFRTGLFTSPHLRRFTERIRIDGQEIDGDRLAELDAQVEATRVPLTYFEVSAVLGFLAFAEAKVDVAVLETGLGGRLDATSTCHPLVCAITSIAFDHEAMLGRTLREIAFEKASIARPGVPMFIAPLPPEAEERVAEVASAAGSPVFRPGSGYPPSPAPPALPGAHQLANAALAVAISRHAATALGRPLAEASILRGLAEVRWPGRLERVGDVLLDCAHNVEGTQALAAALPDSPMRVLVTSIVRDKNAAGMLAVLAPHFDRVIATRSPSERALAPEELASMVVRTRSQSGGDARVVDCVANPREALATARRLAQEVPDGVPGGVPGGLVVVAGSIFLVGALRAALLEGSQQSSQGATGTSSETSIDASDPLP
jgi:dihydrofolate synthase / folylpolyglutamate synthase